MASKFGIDFSKIVVVEPYQALTRVHNTTLEEQQKLVAQFERLKVQSSDEKLARELQRKEDENAKRCLEDEMFAQSLAANLHDCENDEVLARILQED